MIFRIKDKELLLHLIQSTIDYHSDDNPKPEIIFQDVPKNIIDRNFKELFVEKYKSFTIERTWINAFPKWNEAMTEHKHEMDVWVYYLKTPPNSGNLILMDQDETIIPFENEIVIVPKGETHRVEKNNSDDYRISLAMEIVNNAC